MSEVWTIHGWRRDSDDDPDGYETTLGVCDSAEGAARAIRSLVEKWVPDPDLRFVSDNTTIYYRERSSQEVVMPVNGTYAIGPGFRLTTEQWTVNAEITGDW